MPPGSKARPALPGGEQARAHIFNFEKAPLDEVIRVFADVLGINVIVDPNVKGSVTLHSGGEVKGSDLMNLFETILALNQAALLTEGDVYRVVPIQQAKTLPGGSRLDLTGFGEELPEGFGLEIFYLRYVPAADVAKIIKPFSSAGGEVIAVSPTNILLVADTGVKLASLRRLITLLDLPLTRRVSIRIYPVEHVDAGNLAKDLKSIFEAMGIPSKPASGVWVDLIPMVDLNSIAVVSTYREAFIKVEEWLQDLDRQISEVEIGVYVYQCQHANAADIAGVLVGLFGSGEATPPRQRKTGQTSPTSVKPLSFPGGFDQEGRLTTRSQRDKERSENQPKQEVSGPTAHELEEGVRIVVDEANNNIVIRAPRKKIYELLRTVTKLDVFPKQVLIEVMIAEVNLDDRMTLGVEWQTLGNPGDGTFTEGTLTQATDLIPASGLIYTITRTNQIRAALRALARDNKINVVSSPILLAAENLESKINVGQEIPTITSFTTSEDLSTGTGRKITDRSIQYKDTGVILSVTPRINNSGLVRLTIDQEVSSVSETAFGDTESPSFLKRSASTNVITVDGQTIVIGGLIESTIEGTSSGVPFLKDIPLLGYLFKTVQDIKKRTELIIVMTPHVIHDMRDAQNMIQRFGDQLRSYQRGHGPTFWKRPENMESGSVGRPQWVPPQPGIPENPEQFPATPEGESPVAPVTSSPQAPAADTPPEATPAPASQ
ncbi:MAG: type II secretion system secretin GspD [Deltaproteobacteria bacterium]|nr:type II secretion system secretin GspD [Deltaproteobacteria bacterium]